MTDAPLATNAPTNGRRPRAWPAVLAATVVAAIGWVALWWLAIPRYEICIAIYPASAGCGGADRVADAVLWSIVIAVVYFVAVAVALTVGRRMWWLNLAAIMALIATAALSYYLVLY